MDASDFVDAMETRRERLVVALREAHDALDAAERLVNRASDPLLDMLVSKMEGASETATARHSDDRAIWATKEANLLREVARLGNVNAALRKELKETKAALQETMFNYVVLNNEMKSRERHSNE